MPNIHGSLGSPVAGAGLALPLPLGLAAAAAADLSRFKRVKLMRTSDMGWERT